MSRRARRPRRVPLVALAFATAIIVLLAWPAPPQQLAPELRAESIGIDHGNGNLLAVQAWLTSADYASVERVYGRLDAWLDQAGEYGWLNPRTVVVFPEHIGTWLVAAGESGLVQRARTRGAALPWIALRHPWTLARAWLETGEEEPATAALLRARAEAMAADYTKVFAPLAIKHRVTIVAGSIVLPEPRIVAGTITPGRGALFNTSAVFAPDGKVLALVRKVYPIGAELPFTAAGHVQDLPVIDTPAGRLGVLVCADSWYPDTWQRLREQSVELIAVPSFASVDGSWTAPWHGYDGAPAPADVDGADVGRLSEGEAWRRYAMPARLRSSGARAGVNVFLRGELWDLGADGATQTIPESGAPAGPWNGPGLTSAWIP